MTVEAETSDSEVIAAMVPLTGPSRGTVVWLSDPVVGVGLDTDRFVRITRNRSDETAIATLRREAGAYTIEPSGTATIWVNGRPVKSALLRDGDTIEFGNDGPISRFRTMSAQHQMRRSVEDIFGDCLAYVRSSRKPIPDRMTWAMRDFGRRLVLETTVLFRAFVILALIAIAFVLYNQSRRSSDLEAALHAERARLEGIAASLVEAREEALRPGDLTALRQDLEQRLTSNADRLRALERSSGAIQRVIAQTIRSVAFLQGAYGLRHVETGRMLRHVLSKDGIPLQTPLGQPFLSLTGNGPVAEVQFTGTGFLVGEGGLLLTNRHVAVPWLSKSNPQELAAAGMEPVMLKFVAFFPGHEAPVDVTLQHASEDVDLAILSTDAMPANLTGLPLAQDPPDAGDEVVVIGYPTGLRSLLAQSGPAFIRDLQAANDLEFWSVARRLSKAGMIVPLASRGIVGQVAGEAIVYDAETTHGGSGGPVLDVDGRVIAVNSAILPEFGGSNLGIPAARVRAVLDAMESN